MRATMNFLVAFAFFGLSTVAINAQTIIEQGTCGSNLNWELTDDYTLTISGSGNMDNYLQSDTTPWMSHRQNIRSIVIQDGVTSIGSWAFYHCPALASVRLSDNLTSIGSYAFHACASLIGALELPLSLTSIGEAAFHASGITSVTIPENLTTIGSDVFSSSLKTVNFNAVNCKTDGYPFFEMSFTLNIGNKVKSITDRMFSYSCITAVELPGSLTTIGYYAFAGSKLSSITIPEGVTTIGGSAFHGCLDLKTVEISHSVTDIDDLAFYATGLTSIISHAETPPRLGDRVFSVKSVPGEGGHISADIPVHIPACSYFSYSADPEWGRFTNFITNGTPANFLEQEVCMISVDLEYHNEVVWKKQEGISAYNIYREGSIAGQYEFTASIDSDSPNSWIDTESNARVRAYRYKVSGIDACGNESQLSTPHKTMHLTISQGVGNSWNLMWTPYEGIEYSTCRIYRSTGRTLGELELIETMPSSNTSYTDFVNTNDYVYYVVEIVTAADCRESAQQVAQRSSAMSSGAIRSNIVTNNPGGVTKLENIPAENSIQIYPNPVRNELRIENGAIKIESVEIFNLTGNSIDKFLTSNSQIQINVSHLASGVYFVKIETDRGIVTKKFVKK